MLLLLVAACHRVEPLDLPDDPAVGGAPVGARTVTHDGVTFEVWYPAVDATEGPTEEADLTPFLSQAFVDHVGGVEVAPLATGAVRDAEVRDAGEPYPVILFSHGFGGMRLQSVDLTVHLASRGYVVLAPDHPGRLLGDVLPCLFSPPLEGCSLSGFGDDPAPAHLAAALDWLEHLDDDRLADVVDLDRVGLAGHSAGGGSVATMGSADERVDAVLVMAAGPTLTRDVPTLGLLGECDGVVPTPEAEAGLLASPSVAVTVHEATGHLAYSDLCELDLATLADTLLAPRDDLNETLYDALLALGTDGCPPRVPSPEVCDATAYADLAGIQAEIRAAATTFFAAEL